jgi:hypothetical protein
MKLGEFRTDSPARGFKITALMDTRGPFICGREVSMTCYLIKNCKYLKFTAYFSLVSWVGFETESTWYVDH